MPELISGFSWATSIFERATLNSISNTRVLATMLNLSSLSVIAFAWFAVFKPMTTTLLAEVRRTRGVLALIPENVMKNMSKLWNSLMNAE
ncbi:hypothetical protein GEMRC1_001464 [Eukaryota sp. GEM-RC1]